MITVLHSVRSLEPQSGGTGRVVRDLTDTLSIVDDQLRVLLLSQHRQHAPMIERSHESRVDQLIEYSASEFALKMGLPFKRMLNSAISQYRPDVLHDHGMWGPSNHYVAIAARRLRIPIVVHTHGMVEPWSLKYHGWKKRLALRLYKRRDLETAALLFATADQEAASIRRLGLRQPIAVIPNGVDGIDRDSDGVRSVGAQKSHRTLLFLGRIHPKKGLLNLIEAWGRLRPTGWRLRLAGPDEGGHLAEIMRKLRALGLETTVEYVGEVEGAGKKALFEEAELFVLPSFSENFGVVVAEALAHGLPVVTTRATPWAGLPRHGCGWWIDPTVDALSETLRQAMSRDRASLSTMGEKGRAYAREFDWGIIAQQTIEVYRWIVGQGAKPDCVLAD